MSTCSPNTGFLPATDAGLLSKTSPIVWQEINILQQEILKASSSCGTRSFCADVSGNTPMTFVHQVQSISVVSPGSDYQSVSATASVIRVQDLSEIFIVDDVMMPSDVSDAVLVPVVSPAGVITSVNVVSPGSAYVQSDQIEIDHPIGTGFVCTFTLTPTGGIGEITVVSGGTGYSPVLTTVVISDPTGNDAAATASLGPDGEILAVTVSNPGHGYTTNAIATVTSAYGTGAELSVIVSENTFGTDPYAYYLVYTGSESNRLLQSQLNQVSSYFQQLGYSVKLYENPDVPGILSWNICWC